MKKLISTLLLTLAVALPLSGCGNTPGVTTLPPQSNASNSNILIAYFTWADNTQVSDPSSVDTTLSTSASVLAPGNAAIVAGYIHDAVGGEQFSIVVEEPYSSNYNDCLDRAADEKAENARPALASSLASIEDYDIVFLGYPNWWSTVPMAIHSFVEAYDLSGKTVIPFCVHGTSGLASSVRDLASNLPENTTFINNAFGVYRPNTVGCRPLVYEWLAELGFEADDEA